MPVLRGEDEEKRGDVGGQAALEVLVLRGVPHDPQDGDGTAECPAPHPSARLEPEIIRRQVAKLPGEIPKARNRSVPSETDSVRLRKSCTRT